MSDAAPSASITHPALTELITAAHELYEAGKYESAAIISQRALQVFPDCPELWVNLGVFRWNLDQIEAARVAYDRALALRPGYDLALGNLGLLEDTEGNYDKASALYRAAHANNPGYLNACWDLSLLNLQYGKYELAWDDYETRRKRKPEDYPIFPYPYWKGEDLAGKRIYVQYEQGFGDQIIHSRFLLWLAGRAGKVFVCLPHEMIPLLWGYSLGITFLPKGVPIPEVDYVTFIGSLAGRYGARYNTVPPDPGIIRASLPSFPKVSLPEMDVGAKPIRVGICWTGNPNMDRNRDRTVPLELMLELAICPRVLLYSLQLGPGEMAIEQLGASSLVCDLAPQMRRGLTTTASLISRLDLVVTSCTSMAHLALALGKTTWVMLPRWCYWVWGKGDVSPWWPTARMFRQPARGDWRSVTDSVLSTFELEFLKNG